jgi:prepilin-type N-terminal cleavage/methylation domain-containing protein
MIIHQVSVGRRGVTLLEVLTAIFIMGIGLLAILTLFPLGALSMARGVRDDRAAAVGANAASFANAMDLRNDPLVSATLAATPGGFLPPNPDGPGYPVYVDPIYAANGYLGANGSGTLGGVPNSTPGLLRTTASFLTSTQAIARWFIFQDEIQFETTGQPTGNGAAVTRPGTYSSAYFIRRPRSSNTALTELAVVVYANRPLDSVTGETPLGAAVLGPNSLSVTYVAGNKPNIRKGGWIVDVTYQQYDASGAPIPPSQNAATYGSVNGYFYQVASVQDTSASTMTLELETPLKTYNGQPNVNTVVCLENVITVLDRGTSWRP